MWPFLQTALLIGIGMITKTDGSAFIFRVAAGSGGHLFGAAIIFLESFGICSQKRKQDATVFVLSRKDS